MLRHRPSRALLLAPAVVLLLALAGCGTEGADDVAGDPTPSALTPTDGPCTYVPRGEAARDVELPPGEPTYSGDVPAVIRTSIGDLTLTLDADAAPCTVSSFASLVEQGYYDGTSCHRQGNDPGFEFLQCGDPYFDPEEEQPDPRTGTGNPGYTIPDEIDGTETYPAGTLAMANTGAPDSGGGQFFIVFGDSGFDPDYTVWGRLDDASLATLREAASSGNDGPPGVGGRPNTPVTFTAIEIG